jgi:hypothetical protein
MNTTRLMLVLLVIGLLLIAAAPVMAQGDGTDTMIAPEDLSATGQ